jgi:hypothetical protein
MVSKTSLQQSTLGKNCRYLEVPDCLHLFFNFDLAHMTNVGFTSRAAHLAMSVHDKCACLVCLIARLIDSKTVL